MERIAILCDGAFPTQPYPLFLLDGADGIVCCDGALEKLLAYRADARPTAVVGDMDSLSPALQERFSELLYHEEEQEDNDMTKALRWVLREHPEATDIVFLGATGLRADHTVGNLGLLMEYTRMFDLGERRLAAVSDFETAFVVSDSCELHLGEGRRFSLFSADNSLRIRSEGLQWPTDGVVFDAWWKATLNRTSAPVVSLHFSHPAPALIIID